MTPFPSAVGRAAMSTQATWRGDRSGTAFLSRSPPAPAPPSSTVPRNYAPIDSLTPTAGCRCLSTATRCASTPTVTARRETIGQQRICWSRTACVSVWLCGLTAAGDVHTATAVLLLGIPRQPLRPRLRLAQLIAATPADTERHFPDPPRRPTPRRRLLAAARTHRSVRFSPSVAACTAAAPSRLVPPLIVARRTPRLSPSHRIAATGVTDLRHAPPCCRLGA
jgi:hypothetical protein